MTDNEKMREVWDAHDEARNKAWREEPGTFDTLDAFKAGAAWQAAQSVPVVGEAVDYDDDIKKLMRFYAVNDLISLSRIQSEHIARLQKKLPTMRDEQPLNPRSGGE